MADMKALVKSRAVPIYFLLAFAITWGGLLALGGLDGLSGDTWQSDPRLPLIVLAMLAGPSTAGLLLTIVVSGRAGLHELLSRLVRWRVGARWYATALLTAPVVFIAVHLALSLASPIFRPSIVTMSGTASLLLSSIGGALTVGFFEEIGWTGFAIPALRRRHSAVATALILGVPWGAWHLLTNDVWIARTYSGDLPVAVFTILNGIGLLVGQLPAYRLLMVWVYDRTGSLLIAMLMHASLSACTFVLGPEKVTGRALVGYGFALAGAWWIVVTVVAVTWRNWPTTDAGADHSRESRRLAANVSR
jgi:membrane protease YdiL (CAAX protease family)